MHTRQDFDALELNFSRGATQLDFEDTLQQQPRHQARIIPSKKASADRFQTSNRYCHL